MCVHQWWMCKYGICLLNTKFKVVWRFICKDQIHLYRLTMEWWSGKLTTDSSSRAKTPLNAVALRMNIPLKSILSLKHMQHSYSTQAIEEKAKIQGQLPQFNDFIFIWMGAFHKGIVPHHRLKSIQAIWWPPEKRINQDSMAVSWFWET